MVIAGADTKGTFFWFLGLNGAYNDMNYIWYVDVGSALFQTYIIIVLWPLIEWVLKSSIKNLQIARDKASCCLCG